jgi:hypothetical protein
MEENLSTTSSTAIQQTPTDIPSILPPWQDGDYHDYHATTTFLKERENNYKKLCDVISIGNSIQGKKIWCIRLTNETRRNQQFSCIIDGCIHGCEWEAAEACLYLTDYLLINYHHNKTLQNILDTTEIYIIPMLNPDGRQGDYRFNHNDIDLNRNFDIDFGRIRGGCVPLGVLFNRIKIPYRMTPRLSKWLPNFPIFLTNSGRRSFSEPESQALRDLSSRLDTTKLSFYITCHTAGHCIIGPWGAFKPPFKIPDNELTVLSSIEQWIDTNTEYTNYRSGEGIVYQGKSHYASGLSADWFYSTYHIPAFTYEILSEDYEMWMGTGKHDNLVHWMQTTLPVFMYFLVNIESLNNWQIPETEPPLPSGVPPSPLTPSNDVSNSFDIIPLG